MSLWGLHIKDGCSCLGLTSSNNLGCATACSIRLQAMSKYFGSRSMPMNLRPYGMAATHVVPLPINGSKTILLIFVNLSKNCENNCIGLPVG